MTEKLVNILFLKIKLVRLHLRDQLKLGKELEKRRLEKEKSLLSSLGANHPLLFLMMLTLIVQSRDWLMQSGLIRAKYAAQDQDY